MAKTQQYYEAQTQYLQDVIHGIHSSDEKIEEKCFKKTLILANEQRDERKEIYSKNGRKAQQEYEKAKKVRNNLYVEKMEKDRQELLLQCENKEQRIYVLKQILRGKCEAHSSYRKYGSAYKY